MFTWVPTHKAIAQKLTSFEDKQVDLINLLRNLGETSLNDQDEYGHTVKLEAIDPFTFFCYIYKYGPEKRLLRLRQLAEAFRIVPLPEDEFGIPSAFAQKVWLFPHKKDRTHFEMEQLWSFFKAAMNKQVTNELFQDILKIKSTGKTKITEGLFNIDPDHYLPINAQTRPYLEEVMGINPDFKTWLDYERILLKVKAKTKDPFYKISYDAWVWNSANVKDKADTKAEKRLVLESIEQEYPDFPLHELAYLETVSEFNAYEVIRTFYEKLDMLIQSTGIGSDEIHSSMRIDNRIPVTIGRRYVLMIRRNADMIRWAIILDANDEEQARMHPAYDYSSYFSDGDGKRTYCWVQFAVPVKETVPELGSLWDKWLTAAIAYYKETQGTGLKNLYSRSKNLSAIKSFFDLSYRNEVLQKAQQFGSFPVQNKLIARYKALLKVKGLEIEKYKWEILGKDYWDLDTPDMLSMVKRIPFENLVYPLAYAVLKEIAAKYPEELRNHLSELFKGDSNLSERIRKFRIAIDELYKRYNPDQSSMHDERTIASYLAFYKPEIYPLYKNSFYSKYCRLLNRRQALTNEKYEDYTGLLHQFISNYILKDSELLTLYASKKFPKGFADKNYLLLAQDILYQLLDGKQDELSESETKSSVPDFDQVVATGVMEEGGNSKEPVVEAQHFWWLNANPYIWSISGWNVGETQTYTAKNEKGNKRRIYKHFLAAQKGDILRV